MTNLADLLASSSIARDNTRTSNNNWWGARQKTERKDNQKLLVGDRLDQIQLIYKSGAKSKKWLEDICWNTRQGLKLERFFIHFEGLGSHNFLISIPRFSRVLHQCSGFIILFHNRYHPRVDLLKRPVITNCDSYVFCNRNQNILYSAAFQINLKVGDIFFPKKSMTSKFHNLRSSLPKSVMDSSLELAAVLLVFKVAGVDSRATNRKWLNTVVQKWRYLSCY